MKDTIWSRNYTLVFLVNILNAFSFNILAPAIPKYVIFIGSSAGVAGFAATAFTVTAILTRPFAGYYINLKRKKVMLMIALLIISGSILGYSISGSVICIMLFRLLHGVGWGMVTTSSSTIMVLSLPDHKIGSGVGLFGIASSLASVFAPNLGLQLIEKVGYISMFLCALGLAAFGCFLSMLIDEKTLRQSGTKEEKMSLMSRLFAKEAVKPALIILCVGFGMAAISNFIVLYAEDMEIENIGYYFSVAGAVMLVMRPLFGRLSDSRHSRKVVFVSLAGYASVFLVLAFARTLPVFLAAAFLYGTFYGALCPIVQTWCVKAVDISKSGTANSTYYTALDIGQGMGAPLAGILSARIGYSYMYFLMIIPQICAILIAVFTSFSLGRRCEFEGET